jgi:glycyl-tRNA synthetase beta chain
LSISDKLDTLVGCFGVGLIPTGTADPYALRRHTLGIINILLDKKYPLSLNDLCDWSLGLLAQKVERPPDEIKRDVLDFFKGRMQNLLLSRALSADSVEAALSSGCDDLVDLLERSQAVHDLKKEPDFEPLAVAFKRVVNISRSHAPGPVNPQLFESPAEHELYESYLSVSQKALEMINRKNYLLALRELTSLRNPVDKFFEGVMVMAPDEKIRSNRLSLLGNIAGLFFRIGDFSKITTA